MFWIRSVHIHRWVPEYLETLRLICKVKRQYLLTCKVSRYCLLALHGSTVNRCRKPWTGAGYQLELWGVKSRPNPGIRIASGGESVKLLVRGCVYNSRGRQTVSLWLWCQRCRAQVFWQCLVKSAKSVKYSEPLTRGCSWVVQPFTPYANNKLFIVSTCWKRNPRGHTYALLD